MIALLLTTCSLLAADAPANSEEQLNAVLGMQEEAAKAYARLSYDAESISTGIDPREGRVTTHVGKYEIRSRSNTVMAVKRPYEQTSEGNPSGEDGKSSETVSMTDRVMKVLRTPDYVAFWPGLAEQPTVFVHFLEDWKEAEVQKYLGNYTSVSGNVEMQISGLGISEPFYESYKRKTSWLSWDVSQSPGSHDFVAKRGFQDRNQKYTLDLIYSIDPKDGLLSHAEFRLKDSVQIYKVEYTTMQQGATTLRVPSRCVKVSEDTKRPELKRESTITYSNVVDEFDLPPFVLSDLGLLPKVEISRVFPDADKPLEQLPWDGHDLTFRPGRRKE